MIQKQGSIKTTSGCVWSFSRLALLRKIRLAMFCISKTPKRSTHIKKNLNHFKIFLLSQERAYISLRVRTKQSQVGVLPVIFLRLYKTRHFVSWMLLLKTLPSADGANKGVPLIEEYVQRIQSQLSLIGHAWFLCWCLFSKLINVWRQLPLRLHPGGSQSPTFVAPFLETRLTTPLGTLRWYKSS